MLRFRWLCLALLLCAHARVHAQADASEPPEEQREPPDDQPSALDPPPVFDTTPSPVLDPISVPESPRVPAPSARPPASESPPLPAPALAPPIDPQSVADAQRADAWIAEMLRKERERRTGSRWMATIMSGGLMAMSGVLLALDEVHDREPRWLLGSALAPLAAGMAFGIFLPSEHAAPWAMTGLALGGALISTSFCFDGSASDDFGASRDDRLASRFFGVTLASQFLWMIPLAFLDRGMGQQAYDRYFAGPVASRTRAATELLIESDHRTRAKAGVVLIAGMLTLAVVGVGAAVSDEPWVLLAGTPTLTSTLSAVIPLLFRDSRLEMFARGELPRPGVFNF